MKKILSLCTLVIIVISLVSCGGISLPTVEESNKNIEFYKGQIESLEKTIELYKPSFPAKNNIVLHIKTSAFNRLLKKLSENKKEDVIINFLETKPLLSQKKSILGISYKNYLNIDTGYVKMDLTKLRFIEFFGQEIKALIEIKGSGKIKVSGKYTGIPATTAPEVSLYLRDTVTFDLVPSFSGHIMLTPKPKELKLKTKIKIKLLSWKIPWYQEIPLELTEILDPVAIPAAINTDIRFPIPSGAKGKKGVEYIPYTLKFSNMSITALKEIIEYRTDIELIK